MSKQAEADNLTGDHARTHRHFNVGDIVLVRIEPPRDKDEFQFEGPFRIKGFKLEQQVILETSEDIKYRRIGWLKKVLNCKAGES